ncbi:MAG: HipA domain-containing protein [Pseudobdellovibrionaceae bacterium]|nr:HipA domain-containing protein [Pseudobdellovibrionaceae bacterium]
MNPYKKCLVCYQPIEAAYYHSKCAKLLFGSKTVPRLEIGQGDIEKLARNLVNERLAVPGVQRKLSLNLDSEHETPAQRLTIVGYLSGTHILKPPTDEYPHMPEVENLTMHLAEKCNIKTAAHGLIVMKDQSLAYITRRFDRIEKKKIAVEDLCQLSGMITEQKDKSTAERVGKVIRQYSSNPGDDGLRYFELTLFSFITGNADMHMKNFSMITDNPQFISMSPAYDLLSTRLLISEKDDPEELTLSVQGKKSSIKRANFVFLGENLKIPLVTINRTLAFFIDQEENLTEAIDQSILPGEIKQRYTELISARIKRLHPLG